MLMRKLPLFFALQLICCLGFAQVQVANLLCENLTNPIGIDAAQPRFSWQLISDKRNVIQTAYEIIVSNKPLHGDAVHFLWKSEKVNSDSSVHVYYKGPLLKSGTKYFWKVRVWDNSGKPSEWSATATWQMGLLNANNWKAKWIQIGFTEDSINRPSPYFRKEFKATKKIQSATAYITAHGMYEACINGKRVGDAYLTPGWTSYNKRLQYQTYDVTNLLNQGNNAVGVMLGNGWYRGYLAWGGNKNIWGKDLALLFQLDIIYNDGTKELIVSDGTWKSSTGSIVSDEIYDGEIIDARKEKAGWCNAGYNDASWSSVTIKDFDNSILVATQNELIKKHETFKPVQIITTPKGEKVIDFGQNLVGWIMFKAKGNAGDTIKISHAEVLDKDGNFYTENLRAAKAEGVYILKGSKEETFEPH